MAHEFESGFFVREPAWHGLGIVIQDAPDADEALKVAKLDWEVMQMPAIGKLGTEELKTPYMLNYRTSDNSILGIVKNQYKIVQNKDAFAFTSELIGTGEVKYETAGSLAGGKRVWMLAKMPERSILGETHIPYLLFNNSHDGSSAVRVTMTNTRVVCQNTLNIALAGAKRIWSYTHKGDMESKLHEARETLKRSNEYMNAFDAEAERLAMKKFSNQDVKDILEKLFPVEDESIGKRKLNNLIYLRQNFEVALKRADIEHFKNTAYGIINAASDFALHTKPLRETGTYKEKRLEFIMDGHYFIDKAYSLVA